ncbi:hypothetical protein Dimus_035736 [Dionaea muscipula]
MGKRGRQCKVTVVRDLPIQSVKVLPAQSAKDSEEEVDLAGQKLEVVELTPVSPNPQPVNWGLEAESLFDARVVMESGVDPVYLKALKNGGEKEGSTGIVGEEGDLLAGNRDIRKGVKLSGIDRRGEDIVIPTEAVVEEKRNLSGKEGSVKENLKQEVIGVGPVLLMEHKRQLMAPFSCHDVKRALEEVDIDKAPGVDGFSSWFFVKA